MKVILTQEIKGQGGEGDVVEVKYGFAVNYLLPNKLAIEATPGNLKQLGLRRHNIEKREAQRMDNASASLNYLSDKVVVIPMKVGEEGRLFGSVTAPMIADALKEQFDIEVDRRKIEVRGHIKELGDHEVDVNVYRDLKAPIIVKVVSDGETVDIGVTAEQAAELADAEEASEVEVPVTDDVEEPVVEEATIEDDAPKAESMVADELSDEDKNLTFGDWEEA
jgi:large subunit ribosomal protein L9